MNTIDDISTYTPYQSAEESTDILGKDAFLEMLVAQLKNQDPLNPMDGTEFVAQLAQFSGLEQMINLNTQMESLIAGQDMMTEFQASNLIGKEVALYGSSFHADGQTETLAYDLFDDAENVTVTVYDEKGAFVETIEAGSQSAGTNTVTWDCSTYAEGAYSFSVAAADANGNAVSTGTRTTGIVSGVRYNNGTVYLTVNSEEIPFENVMFIGAGEEATS